MSAGLYRADPSLSPPRPPWAILALLLVVSLAGRLTFVLRAPADEAAMARSLPDQREYLDLGRSLLAGEGLRFVDLRFGTDVKAFRTAGYPLVVAACGGDVRAIRVAQVLLDTSTVLAAYVLARRWLAPGPGVLAAAIVAVNPFMVFFTSLVLSETVFTAMLAWSVALFAASTDPRRRRRRWAFWSAAVLAALSVHVRPAAIGLPLVLGVSAALAGAPTGFGRSRGVFGVPAGASMLILTILTLLPWAARNRTVVGEWVWTSTNEGFTLYDGLNPDADGSSNQSFVRRMPQLQTMGEAQRSAYLAAEARAWAAQNPLRVAELAAIKLARTWSPVPLSSEYRGRRAYAVVAAAYAVPLFAMTLFGLRRGVLPASGKAILLAPAVYFSVAHAVSVGSLRYRVPSEPMLAVIAASAVAVAPRSSRRDGGGGDAVPDRAETA